MAVINKTGITNGTTIQAEHVTRAIDALSGGSTDSVVATGSFNGTLTGNATTATTATTATNATNTAVTNTSTGTGPYYITFVESATGNVAQRVDATGLTYNATTDTITATASFATQALSASYAANVPSTASYALAALSSSYAVTASFALNAGGGTGVGFPFTGSAQVTGSMGITGSLRVRAAALNQYGLLVTGSVFASGSTVGFVGELDAATNMTANKNGIINLAGLGGSGFNGKFVLPKNQPEQPVAGTIYWDDSAGILYVYKESDPPGWTAI
jgi:hypothetical protein